MKYFKVVFLFYSVNLFGQINLKNELFDTLNYKGNLFYSMISKNNEYYISLNGQFLNQNYTTKVFVILDENFELISEKRNSLNGVYTTIPVLQFNSDSTKIYSCGFQTYDGNSKGYICSMTLNGDTLAFLNVGDNTYNWRIGSVIEMPDHTILAVGGRSKYPVGGTNPWDEYPLAMKLDTLGNVLWTKLFTFTERGLNLGVQQTLDGNYLINSYTFFNPGTGTGSVYKPTLIKIDSLGNKLWHRLYGGSENNNNGIAGIVEMEDSTLIFEADLYKYSDPNIGSERNPTIFKTTKVGEIIWQKEYTEDDLSISAGQFKLFNDKLISTGMKGGGSQNHTYGFLRFYDIDGNFLNEKLFSYLNTNLSYNNFYDFTQTPDSGFLFVGYTQYYSTDSIGPYRAWIVKTDKYGCIVQDCQLTGIENIQELQELSIFPNPSQNVFFINSSQEIKNVSVFTINGKRILQHNVNSTFAKIDLTDFSSGIYFVEVQTEKGETIRKKLVKVE